MAIKQLTAENATIQTASVEVRTLTISGKQVTLAVFRQLPAKEVFFFPYEEDLTDEEYAEFEEGKKLHLFGVKKHGHIWGRVNYCTKECSSISKEHTHFVWQEGEILHRSSTRRRITAVDIAIRDWGWGYSTGIPQSVLDQIEGVYQQVGITWSISRWETNCVKVFLDMNKNIVNGDLTYDHCSDILSGSVFDIANDWPNMVYQAKEWNETVENAMQSPQLFIAV